jgi:aspartyl-tRNA(Asn)/glutamyl-tRNA(Gln) amidotransferase subunit A
MNKRSLADIQSDLNSGVLTVSNLVSYYVQKIEESKELNIFVEVFAEEAKQQAKALDEKLKAGETLGKLFGAIISIKDVICYKDHKVTAASKVLDNFESKFTATALQRLLDEDAIVIGRTNCDEFAMGSSNENSVYGATRNGVDPERVAGGSSGAAAVSVQQDTCLMALGTDTGGSVRQPAAFNGVIGMKPSYGRISRYGLIAYGSSFDQIGVLGHHLDDVYACIEMMSGPDEMDATSNTIPFDTTENIPSNISFAVIDEVMNHEKLSESIKLSSAELLKTLRSKGHTVNNLQFSLLEYLVPAYYVLTTAEASSNLGRYDGIRYGHRSEKSNSIDTIYQESRNEGFGHEVKRRIMLGTFVLSSGYYDAYYTKAQKVRRLVTESINNMLETNDCLIMPTTNDVAWKIGALNDDPVAVYLSDVYTVLANLVGIPAVSIPLGKDKSGNPFGIQLMSKAFSERKLYLLANVLKSTINP